MRNRLKYALTYGEVISILMQRLVMVDGKVRTDKTYPAGFMGKSTSFIFGVVLHLRVILPKMFSFQRTFFVNDLFCWCSVCFLCVLVGWVPQISNAHSFWHTDVVSIPKTNENFRLMYDTKGRFRLHSVRDEEAKVHFWCILDFCTMDYEKSILHLFVLWNNSFSADCFHLVGLCNTALFE